MSAQPRLRLLDEHGQLHDMCSRCQELQHALDELANRYHGALSQIGKLKADKNAEAASHELWPVAVKLFEYWKAQTGHHRAEWAPAGNAERFWVLLPRLKHYGAKNCAAAIAGIAHEPNKRLLKSGRWEIYDDFETCFGSLDKCRRYILRRPREWVLPLEFAEL